MNRSTEFLLVCIPIFFALLHIVIIPMLKRISIAVQGTSFTYRLQAGAKSRTINEKAKWDILWSALAVMVSIALTLLIIEIIN